MDQIDLYPMIIYIFYYILIIFELLLYCFADTSVLPHADDPQVCVTNISCNLLLIPVFYLMLMILRYV